MFRTVSNIPGLLFCREFLSVCEATALFATAKTLRQKVMKCDDSLSPVFHEHTQRQSVSFSVKQEDETISGQRFSQYGGTSHTLLYFRATEIPSFARPLGERLLEQQIPCASRVKTLSLNFYDDDRGSFEFHKDIETNGAVTSILSLGAQCQLELVQPSVPPQDGFQDYKVIPEECVAHATIELTNQSCVVLTGPVRTDWLHRVLPVQGERQSFVFGMV